MAGLQAGAKGTTVVVDVTIDAVVVTVDVMEVIVDVAAEDDTVTAVFGVTVL